MKGTRAPAWPASQAPRKKTKELFKPRPAVLDWSLVDYVEWPKTEHEVFVRMIWDAKMKCEELGISDGRITEVLTLHHTPRGICTLEEAEEGNHLKVRIQGWQKGKVVSVDVDVRVRDVDEWAERI